jgi:NCAIR mutase (PurE)-related protein
MSHADDICLDEMRHVRLGFPEIIYGEFKSADQIARLVATHDASGKDLLITRLDGSRLPPDLRGGTYDPVARTFTLRRHPRPPASPAVAIISGGSSDRPVVAETLNTLSFLDIGATCVQDVGVAGLHRLTDRLDDLRVYAVLIVIAGFEGALASVVAGLLSQPVIAVPTSVGYGVAAGGQTALHAMLASCANGLLVTNVDNGCGAALAARRILRCGS